jgi:putative solute:sodium symporter small subunit
MQENKKEELVVKKIDKSVADAYFRARTMLVVICLIIGGLASFGVVAFAEFFAGFTFMGMPAHYYMGAQGAVVTFVILLFGNAIISDKIDEKFGIDEEHNTRVSSGKVLDH